MTPILETDRLKLTPLSTQFISDKYLDWMNDPKVIEYLESGGDYSLEKLNYYLKEVEKRAQFFWAISIKETGVHVGNIKIDPIHPIHQYGEFGIMIGDRNAWGKGIAKEASNIVLEYCFKTLSLRKINLGVLSNNNKAIKLYKTLGFEQEGYFKNHVKHNNEFIDTIRMAIFNSHIR